MDWADPDNAYNVIEEQLGTWENSAIILMHDWTGMSSILQDIIDLARSRNFRLVDMDECLGNSPISPQVPEGNNNNESIGNNDNDDEYDNEYGDNYDNDEYNHLDDWNQVTPTFLPSSPTTQRPGNGNFNQWSGWNDWLNWSWAEWNANKNNPNSFKTPAPASGKPVQVTTKKVPLEVVVNTVPIPTTILEDKNVLNEFLNAVVTEVTVQKINPSKTASKEPAKEMHFLQPFPNL